MKPYAKEASKKPVMVSFGHRPRSASRTFHPATMKFRLRHGELAMVGGKDTYGFGLPVSILEKILHAPKLEMHGMSPPPGTGHDAQENPEREMELRRTIDPHELFTLPEQSTDSNQKKNVPTSNHDRDEIERNFVEIGDDEHEMLPQQNSLAKDSWVSQTQHSLELQRTEKHISKTNKKGKLAPVSKKISVFSFFFFLILYFFIFYFYLFIRLI